MKVLIDNHKGSMMKEATMMSMVKNVADTLEKHYPGHAWAVGPSNDYSMLAIWNEALSMNYGMWVRVNEIDPEYKNIMRWAGELLERATLSRGAANQEEIESLNRDVRGEVIFDQ
tara:strand:- start:5662 stop:6006 length:345 start_codon:yes stop_codon:yes gene_type:complete